MHRNRVSARAPAMVGPDARVGCEPGQVRKEAAISMSGPVPSVARPWSGRSAANIAYKVL